jgi:glycosyltransferase involved in cell wall biosynthesis
MVTISVIMPFYNSREYLKESIASIINQTFTDFELILLDDGSTDFPEDIINSFSDNRIRYYIEDTNKGIVYQLNKGINLAKGKYIARMDADDISRSDRFQKQVDFLENNGNSKVDVLATNALKIGDEFGVMDYKNYKPEQISFLLNFYCPILHPTVMMRKSIFDNGQRYSEDYKYAEDYALWRMVDNGRNIAILPIQLLEYRIHKRQTNQDLKRIEIQTVSCLKVGSLKSIKYFERFIFTPRLKRLSIDSWFGNQNGLKANILQRNYIRFMKRFLGIKSELLNNIIHI